MTESRKLTIRGYLEETGGSLPAARRSYALATRQARRDLDARSETFALARLAHLARVRGRLAEAARFLHRARGALARFPGDHRLAATVFLAAGNVALDQTVWPIATKMYRRAISHARCATWPRMEATALNNLGLVHRRQGRFTRATLYILQALRIDRRGRDRTGMARDLGNLGIIAHEQGNYRDALRYGRKALALDRDMGNYTTLAQKRIDVAFPLIRLGQYVEAIKELNGALQLARKYKRPEDEARCWSARGLLHRERGKLIRSVWCHERALTIFRLIRRRESVAQELVEFGEVHRAVGNRAAARQCFKEALKLFRALGNVRMVNTTTSKLRSLEESIGSA
jgi:tetratricopeptide (TPR) repeat protein